MKKCLFLPALLLLLTLPAYAAFSDSAAAAVLVHADGGEVLYAHDEKTPLPMASTTKLMTALVVLERCRLSAEVCVDGRAVGAEGSSMYLRSGELLSVEELLCGLLLASGNDAALALAYHVSDSVEDFCTLMNEKAAELGMENTHYVNPNGLHEPDHYTTALDLSRLMAACLQNPDFCRITACTQLTAAGRTLQNHNRLLSRCEGVFSGKTGYTKAAGRCLVTACERGGLRLICVTLNDRSDWADHAALYEAAYGDYELFSVDACSVQASLPLLGGEESTLPLAPREGLRLCIRRGSPIEKRLYLPPFVFAPVSPDRALGRLEVRTEDRSETLPLYAAEQKEQHDALTEIPLCGGTLLPPGG